MADGKVRVFVTSRAPDCGLFDVSFDMGMESSATWTHITWDMADCDLDPEEILGSLPTDDGRHVLLWGLSTEDICHLELKPPANPADPWPVEKVVEGSGRVGVTWTVVGHPQIDDVYLYGLFIGSAGNPSATTPGLYAIERRQWPWGGWTWEEGGEYERLLSGGSLQHRAVVDIDIGPGAGSNMASFDHIYLTTTGGGFWDGAVSW